MGNDLQRINATKYELQSPFQVSDIVNPVTITGLNLDAFERLRVSIPGTQYEYNFQYNKAPLIWQDKLSGSGSSTHRPLESSVRISTGITRTANQYKNIGYFDSQNGIMFGQDDTGIYFQLRSTATGSTVDRKVYQSSWNIRQLNSISDPFILDIDKTQIFVCDVQWLGVGAIRCGFEFNGVLYWCHSFYNTNLLEIVYMTSANLPMRYEVIDGSSGAIRQTFQYFRYRPGKSLCLIMTFDMGSKTNNSLDQICATVITEGGVDEETYYQHSVNMGVTPKGITTTKNNLISIRPKSVYPDASAIVNRSQIVYEGIDLTVTGNGTIRWELVYNPTLGGTPSWQNAGANAVFEFDTAGTTVTGGEIVASGYASSSANIKQTVNSFISAKYPLTLDIDGLNPRVLTLCAVAFTGTVDVIGSITARGYY